MSPIEPSVRAGQKTGMSFCVVGYRLQQLKRLEKIKPLTLYAQ